MTQRLDYQKIAPNGVKALGGVYGYVLQSGLPAELVDLVYLRVSQINNCAYCLDTHTRDLIKRGVRWRSSRCCRPGRRPVISSANTSAPRSPGSSEHERAALAWAETVTRVSETGVPDEPFQAARAVFEENELVDLTIAIGLRNIYSRMAISFRNTPQAVLEN